MNVGTAAGLGIALVSLALSNLLEGGELAAFVNLPALLVVFGGTFGAALVAFPGETVRQLPKLISRTFVYKAPDALVLAETLLRLAERARREGLLALEEEMDAIDSAMLRRGMMLVIDGTDPELVRSILESDSEMRRHERENESGLLEAMGGYSPTMGIIGTVMGLVHVLGNLSDPSKLGSAIAVAFIATFYGVATANILWLPMGTKLKKQAAAEALVDEMILEGLNSIQSGENPRILRERLEPYLPKYGSKSAQEQKTDEPNALQDEVQAAAHA